MGKEQVTFLGTQLKEAKKSLIIQVLDANSDLFVWLVADMPSIDPNNHCHWFSICQYAKPNTKHAPSNLR